MSEHNPRCQVHLQDKYRRAMRECIPDISCIPVDMTRVPVCGPPDVNSGWLSTAGCPRLFGRAEEYCCNMPGTIEAQVMKQRPAEVCRSHRATTASRPCRATTHLESDSLSSVASPPKPRRDPLCFNWTVDEVGPNDSYGLNGLNWYDWGKMRELNQEQPSLSSKHFTHPGN
ncbi:hypothetical protein Btru_028088 [Bulinus truncatus]|nr:hypothetical protein Btru_028088 [Bulinus truncatus]